MRISEIRQELAEAGERLLVCQQNELKLLKRCRRRRQDDAKLLEQWRAARQAAEDVAEEYARAVRRYREAFELRLLPHLRKMHPRGAVSARHHLT